VGEHNTGLGHLRCDKATRQWLTLSNYESLALGVSEKCLPNTAVESATEVDKRHLDLLRTWRRRSLWTLCFRLYLWPGAEHGSSLEALSRGLSGSSDQVAPLDNQLNSLRAVVTDALRSPLGMSLSRATYGIRFGLLRSGHGPLAPCGFEIAGRQQPPANDEGDCQQR
jgi:hypothetical protein